ncbi:uncharacterized protein LOC108676399 [Hyalella azteca]|uniref:Uncharacterized protein LOC108676399 n=1 Tax=Hyalella azteca TaxID=294128 RepID=A0A8B7P1R2_HYAAZ|nr:uncharacterized protein LOC108676399 [Hyalella azteca]
MLISSLNQVGRFTPKEMCLSTAKNSSSYRCLQNYLPIFFENNVQRHVCSSACHAANTKQFDDDPDFNIDFENELNWLKDRIAMSTQSKPQTDHPNLNENSDEHWLCKDHVEHDETTGTQNASEYESKFLSYPHSNWGPIPTGKHLFVPRLTADVAVELLTCELSEILK